MVDWKTCKDKYLAKEIKQDINLANSLINSSSKKMKSQMLLDLNDETASSKITLAYDSLRELLEALAVIKGYKIYNHECYCSFLKEIMEESLLGDTFDSLRKIRNSINYYGKEISAKEAEPVLKKIQDTSKDIKSLIDKEKKK